MMYEVKTFYSFADKQKQYIPSLSELLPYPKYKQVPNYMKCIRVQIGLYLLLADTLQNNLSDGTAGERPNNSLP